MTKVEAIVQPYKVDEVLNALIDIGVEGITITDVLGHSRDEEYVETYRGSSHSTRLLAKAKFEVVVPDGDVQAVSEAICRSARTGRMGDGKVFIINVRDAVRIRNGQCNEAAL